MRSSDSTSRRVIERAHGEAVFADHLRAEADALRAVQALESDFGIFDVTDFVTVDPESFARGMPGRENFADAQTAQNFGALAEKFFDGRTDEHRVAARVEEQQAVFEAAHDLIEIFAQSAENFAHVSQLFSDADDFGADGSEFVAAFDRLEIEFAGGDAIELGGDAVNRSERGAADDQREQSGEQHGGQRVISGGYRALARFHCGSAQRKGRCECRRRGLPILKGSESSYTSGGP